MLTKFLCLSDLHGNRPDIKEDFDVMLIGGDICPVFNHSFPYQNQYLFGEFVDWVNKLPFKDENSKVVVVPGNHDFAPMGFKAKEFAKWNELSNGRIVPLFNDVYDYNGIIIAGTPWCHVFGHWAFMVDDMDLSLKYHELNKHNDIDVFVSHDAPCIDEYGVIHQGWQKGKQVGNVPLRDFIIEAKPKIALHGHIHTSSHELKEIAGTYYRCISILDENYDVVYEPFVFYMNENKEVITEKQI